MYRSANNCLFAFIKAVHRSTTDAVEDVSTLVASFAKFERIAFPRYHLVAPQSGAFLYSARTRRSPLAVPASNSPFKTHS